MRSIDKNLPIRSTSYETSRQSVDYVALTQMVHSWHIYVEKRHFYRRESSDEFCNDNFPHPSRYLETPWSRAGILSLAKIHRAHRELAIEREIREIHFRLIPEKEYSLYRNVIGIESLEFYESFRNEERQHVKIAV